MGKPALAVAFLLLGLAACAPAPMGLQVRGALPSPVFELTAGSVGLAPCLTEFRVIAERPANVYSIANWSIRRVNGCAKPAQVVYGLMPDGFVDRFPGEEGLKSYPAIHWPMPLVEGTLYKVTAQTGDGRKGAFFVVFEGGVGRVTRGK